MPTASPSPYLRPDLNPNLAGGYLAAGWASLLHDMGPEFTNLDFETADAINTAEFMEMANHHLGYEGSDANGSPYNTEGAVQRLTGDQAGTGLEIGIG